MPHAVSPESESPKPPTPDYDVPDKLVDVWSYLPWQRQSCGGGHDFPPRCLYVKEPIDCPNVMRLPSELIPYYKYNRIDQLPQKQRNREAFKMALADINPRVKLLDHSGNQRTCKGKVVSCGWAQTRAHLGCEGHRQTADRWEFEFDFDKRNCPLVQWMIFLAAVLRHEAVKRIAGHEYGLQELAEKFVLLTQMVEPGDGRGMARWERSVDKWMDEASAARGPLLVSLEGSSRKI